MLLSQALLWVQLVECAVHAHCNIQVVQSSVLTDLVHDSGHSSSANLSCSAGHRATHLLDDNTVIAGAVEPQLLQDRPDLQQGQTIAVECGGGHGERVRGQPTAAESLDTSQLFPEAKVGLSSINSSGHIPLPLSFLGVLPLWKLRFCVFMLGSFSFTTNIHFIILECFSLFSIDNFLQFANFFIIV